MDKKSLVNDQEQTADNEKRAAELLELILENEKFIKHVPQKNQALHIKKRRKDKGMDKKSLVNDMKRFTNASFITRKQLAQWMGKKDAHCVDRYLHGLDRVGQQYFIPDVVDAVIATREWR